MTFYDKPYDYLLERIQELQIELADAQHIAAALKKDVVYWKHQYESAIGADMQGVSYSDCLAHGQKS